MTDPTPHANPGDDAIQSAQIYAADNAALADLCRSLEAKCCALRADVERLREFARLADERFKAHGMESMTDRMAWLADPAQKGPTPPA